MLQDKVIRELELERFGYHVYPKDPAFFSPFPDGRYLLMWSDTRATCEEIAKFSAHDAEVYPRYEDHIDRLARFIEPLLLQTPPSLVPRGFDDWRSLARLGLGLNRMPKEERIGHLRILTQSVKDFLDPWFESEQLKTALATDGVIGTKGGPYTPGTAYVLMHHCMGGVGGKRGLWGFVRGGMGSITQAMADSARSRGAEIRTEARAERVLIQGGRAVGIVLEGGEEIRARIVVSGVDPKRTFLKLVESSHLDKEFLGAVRAFKSEGVSMKPIWEIISAKTTYMSKIDGLPLGAQIWDDIENASYVEASAGFANSSEYHTILNAATMAGVVAVKGTVEQMPQTYALLQNYPNPFNPTTVITYHLPINSFVTLKIYDVLGREVVGLVNGRQNAGSHSVIFNASNLPNVARYFDRLQAGTFSETKKLLLLK